MDAVEFIKERQRYCKDRSCKECALNNQDILCGNMNFIDNPEKLVDFIERWAKEHPIVTNSDKLVEVFGEIRYGDITPDWLKQEYKAPEGEG